MVSKIKLLEELAAVCKSIVTPETIATARKLYPSVSATNDPIWLVRHSVLFKIDEILKKIEGDTSD